jgi:Flp pilus assembly protein CpaB
MRRGRILIFLVLIVVIGLAVAVFAIQQFVLRSPDADEPQFVNVYVAGQNIPQGGDITEGVLTTISLPEDKVAAVMFTQAEVAQLTTNKVARYPLDQGVVITESMVVDKSGAVSIAGPQWAVLVPPGMTAVTVPATRISLGGYGVADGAHVNIVACLLFIDVDPSFQSELPNFSGTLTGTGFAADALPILSLGVSGGGPGTSQGRLELDPSLQQPFYLVPSESQRPRPVCQMLLQDVVVMKRGDFPLSEQSAQAREQAEDAPAPAMDTVTLIVSPQDAIMLTYLTYTNARMTLTLRNPSDQSRQATEAATLQFLLSQYNIPVPAKLPYVTQPRAVFGIFIDFYGPPANSIFLQKPPQ